MSSDFDVAEEDELLMHNYTTLPSDCKKYWRKRYDLFSRFDDGVWLTAELWYSVTPEITAQFTARLVKMLLPNAKNILDICCGGGGNTIQFGQEFELVGGIDVRPNNVKCSEHNCSLYGVENAWFVCGDWNELSKSTDWIPSHILPKFDFVFCSPPWGGPKYKAQDVFDLAAMEPFNILGLCESISRFTDHFGLFLPRRLDLTQISEVTKQLYGKTAKTRVVYLYEYNHLIGLLAIFGESFTVDI